MKTIYFILVFFVLSSFLSAAIINVPADQSTIQAGIDASTNGDTVLVQPGTYVENINFNGKNIYVIIPEVEVFQGFLRFSEMSILLECC